MTDPRQSNQRTEAQDELALDVEEITDHELPIAIANDSRVGPRRANLGREATTIGDHERGDEMTDRNETSQQGKAEARDNLALEVEEIADLEMPPTLADDVRGGRCHAVHAETNNPTRATG